jgi:hypothetical protein
MYFSDIATLQILTNTQTIGNDLDLRHSETASWDIAPCAPHAWALLADNAIKDGNIKRAEELIQIAYMTYDTAEANQQKSVCATRELHRAVPAT